jgi:multidrug transporter EmrE-like cation transporter
MNQLNLTATIIGCVLLTAAGQIALKLGASNPALAGLLEAGNLTAFAARALSAPVILAGLLLYALSTILWLFILARADLSYAYPFVSLGFVLTAVFGRYALQEPLTMPRIAGIALIVLGVIFVSRS